jgi:hypothetical protein
LPPKSCDVDGGDVSDLQRKMYDVCKCESMNVVGAHSVRAWVCSRRAISVLNCHQASVRALVVLQRAVIAALSKARGKTLPGAAHNIVPNQCALVRLHASACANPPACASWHCRRRRHRIWAMSWAPGSPQLLAIIAWSCPGPWLAWLCPCRSQPHYPLTCSYTGNTSSCAMTCSLQTCAASICLGPICLVREGHQKVP